jgi:predicted RND superfamily exporter protein
LHAYLQFLLRYRLAVVLVIAAVSVVAAWSASRGVLASSVIKLFFGDNPKYTRYRALADEFGGSDVLVAAYADPALLTAEGLARVGRIAERVSALDFVKSVQSLDRASRVQAEGDELLIEPYRDLVSARGSVDAALRAAMEADPLVSGGLLSRDGEATALLVEITADSERPIEAIPQMIEQVAAAFVAEGLSREQVRMAGIVPESSEATAQAQFTLGRLFPLTVLVLALVVFVLFLRIWPVIITGGVALVSILWTLGLAVAVDPHINVLMAMVPGMVTVIAFSDIIHLYSAFVRECEHGLDQRAAVLKSGVEVGEACLYTSLTTFVGFASLVFIPTPLLRQLGVVLGAGVGIALLLAMTLVPIILSVLPGVGPGWVGEGHRAARGVDRLLQACMHLSLRRPRAVVAGFAVLAVASAVGIAHLEVEASFARRLSPSNPVRQAQDFIRTRFSGSNFLDVYVTAPEGKDLLDPEVFQGLARFHQRLADEPGVDGVLSLVSLVDLLHRQMSGAAAGGAFMLPGTRALLAQYLLLFEVSGGEGLERVVDEPRKVARLSVRLSEDGLRGLARSGDRAVALAQEVLPPGAKAEATGIAYLLGDWITFILEGQRRGLGFAVLSTTLMMVLCLRSWRVGVGSMIPNVLPLMVLGGYVGGLWDQVDSDVMLVATFAIGIAVDDTIHFLTRFRFESQREADRQVALHRTFVFTGRAIVQTTVILCLGFLPFAWSDYFSTRIIGTLLPLTLIVALVADLLLVPAMVNLGILTFRKESKA